MPEPSKQELKESIEELAAYRDRLHDEVTKIGQKLRMPKQKLDSTLENHSELKKVKQVLSQLIKQRDQKSHS